MPLPGRPTPPPCWRRAGRVTPKAQQRFLSPAIKRRSTMIQLANIYWRDLPILIIIVSLVYGATRFDDWEHIFRESFRWMLRLSGFLGTVMLILYVVARVFI